MYLDIFACIFSVLGAFSTQQCELIVWVPLSCT